SCASCAQSVTAGATRPAPPGLRSRSAATSGARRPPPLRKLAVGTSSAKETPVPANHAIRLVLPIAAVLALASAPAHAVTIFTAQLTNAAEVPPAVPTLANGEPRPASFGTASFVLNDDQTALTFTVTVENIDFTGTQTADPNDDLTVAHLHG